MKARSGSVRLVLEDRGLLVTAYVVAGSKEDGLRPGWHWWLDFDHKTATLEACDGHSYGTESTWAKANRMAWRHACKVRPRKAPKT